MPRDAGPRYDRGVELPALSHSRGTPVPPETIQTRIAWPRDRYWRPGELITLEIDGVVVTARLRGVMRDTDPSSPFATVALQPVRSLAASAADEDEELSAAG
jgi:hypothetical protein